MKEATVVLLHGMGRSRWSMVRPAAALQAAGYRVLNLSYRSRTMPVEILAQEWLPDRLRQHGVHADSGPDLHFVTHSLGGIMLRCWLAQAGTLPAVKRVVMIAPPNQGTPLVDRIGHWRAFRCWNGVNGHRLGTGADQLPAQLGPWPATGPELGIIAGDCSINPLLAALTGRPGDGKVTVAHTRLDGMSDHLVLPYSHTWLQYHQTTLDQITAFLAQGRFKH